MPHVLGRHGDIYTGDCKLRQQHRKQKGNISMPIDHHRLWNSKQAAKEFLLSHVGVLLHELGRYVAANESGLAAGHIVIEASDCKTTSGRFVIRVST